jgi:hypothetical protein
MRITGKRQRDMERAAHLIAALLILGFIYTPLSDLQAYSLLVRLVVVPVLTASGMAMWQQARLRRLLGLDRTRPQRKAERGAP